MIWLVCPTQSDLLGLHLRRHIMLYVSFLDCIAILTNMQPSITNAGGGCSLSLNFDPLKHRLSWSLDSPGRDTVDTDRQAPRAYWKERKENEEKKKGRKKKKVG